VENFDKVNPIKAISKIAKISKNNSKKNNDTKQRSKEHKEHHTDLIDISFKHRINNDEITYSKPNNHHQDNNDKSFSIDNISDNVFTFLKLMYEVYKEENPANEAAVLNDFYHLSHQGITLGYKEALNNLNHAEDSIKKIITDTYDHIIEKLDNWFAKYNIELTDRRPSDLKSIEIEEEIKKFVSKLLIEQKFHRQ
jgi:hypothetical protein